MSASENLNLNDALDFACRAADQAGILIREGFRLPLEMTLKSNISPVTAVDQAVERCIRAMIEAEYPTHGILGEELGSQAIDNEYVWVIDPIDGTKQFAAGLQTFGTLIALARNTMPVVGIIDQPITGDRWTGVSGLPTCLNGNPIQTRTCGGLSEAVLSTTSPDSFKGEAGEVFRYLNKETRWTVYGGGCLGYGLVASGTLDIHMEAGNDPYDYCAHVPIVEGAGGKITDWDGAPLTIHSGDKVLATGNPTLHRETLARIRKLTNPDTSPR